MAEEQYDAIVIGAGQSGGPLTSAFAENGFKTALIERSKVGGTCINWGCTPSKTMIGSARVAHLARRAADYGVSAGPVSVDLSVVRQRKRDIVDMFHEGSRSGVESTEGVDLLMGEARFTGEKAISVTFNDGGTRELTAERIVIDTGLETVIPPIDGIEEVPYLTSTSIMELDTVPEGLIVLGGGYIGLEFAQMFRRFGSEVSIVQRRSQLMVGQDEDVANEVYNVLTSDGIEIYLDSNLESVSSPREGQVTARIQEPAHSFDITGSHLLVAAGRQPATKALALDQTGIEVDDNGAIPVNDKLETQVPGIWAVGDVKGGPAFTHISYDDYRVLVENLFGNGGATIETRVVPYVVFIDPELARVGMSEQEAHEAGYDVQVASMKMESVARALETDETRGMMKAVVDRKTDQILGATIFGIRGGEIMSLIQLAMITGTPYTTLRDAPFAHPTVAEALNNLFSEVSSG